MTYQIEAHTPTPWAAQACSVFKGSDCIVNCDTDNATVEVYEANAAFIARAVNNHDALVVAATDLLFRFEKALAVLGNANEFIDIATAKYRDAINAAKL